MRKKKNRGGRNRVNDERNMSSGRKTGSLSLEEQLVRILSKLPYHNQKHHENQKHKQQQKQQQKHKQSGRGGRSSLVKNVLLGDGDVFEIPLLLSAAECRQIIAVVESTGFVATNQRETRYAAARRNGRLQCDAPALAELLWTRCAGLFQDMEDGKKAVGFSHNFRFYKYSPGDAFGMHVDDSVDHCGGVKSAFTLLVYLNDNLEGGATVFYRGSNPKKAKEVLAFLPKQGSALAHIHGPRCMLHEGAQVKSGIKYLMRTDVLYG
eukprot:g231.t1